jgi:hypothetical protein
MTKRQLATVAIGVILVSASWAQVPGTRTYLTGANSLFGPTGLIVIPTAYSIENNTFAVSGSYGKDIRGPAANFGILQYIEIGGAFIDREGASNKAIANGKVTILPQNFRNFELGIGVIDAFDATERTLYLVGSADFIPPNIADPIEGSTAVGLKVHAGLGTGMFSEEPFAGAELLFGNKISVIGEWDTKNVNGAIRYSPNDHIRIQAGFMKTNLFFGITGKFRM